MSGVYELSVYLPPTEDWYFYDNRQIMPSSYDSQTLYLGDLQQGIFVMGGSILPILNYNWDRMSILDAIYDPIKLEIFPISSD